MAGVRPNADKWSVVNFCPFYADVLYETASKAKLPKSTKLMLFFSGVVLNLIVPHLLTSGHYRTADVCLKQCALGKSRKKLTVFGFQGRMLRD